MAPKIDEREKRNTISPARKIGSYYKENGLLKTMLRVAEKTLGVIINIRKYCIIEKSLSGNIPFIKAKLDVTFRMAEVNDMDFIKDMLEPCSVWYRIIKKRFEKGQTCILCFHENRAIGYVWITFVPETDRNIGLTVRPRDNESYGFDLFVLPEYRKFLIGYELISRWFQYSKDSGRGKAIGVVAQWNKPMLMTTKLVFGFKVTRKLRAVEFFKKRGFIISSKIIDPHS